MREGEGSPKEWVLRGDTVLYVSAPDIRKAIEYDLEQERQFDYSKVDRNGLVSQNQENAITLINFYIGMAEQLRGRIEVCPCSSGNIKPMRSDGKFLILAKKIKEPDFILPGSP